MFLVKFSNGDNVPLVTIIVLTPFIFKDRIAMAEVKHQNFITV